MEEKWNIYSEPFSMAANVTAIYMAIQPEASWPHSAWNENEEAAIHLFGWNDYWLCHLMSTRRESLPSYSEEKKRNANLNQMQLKAVSLWKHWKYTTIQKITTTAEMTVQLLCRDTAYRWYRRLNTFYRSRGGWRPKKRVAPARRLKYEASRYGYLFSLANAEAALAAKKRSLRLARRRFKNGIEMKAWPCGASHGIWRKRHIMKKSEQFAMKWNAMRSLTLLQA